MTEESALRRIVQRYLTSDNVRERLAALELMEYLPSATVREKLHNVVLDAPERHLRCRAAEVLVAKCGAEVLIELQADARAAQAEAVANFVDVLAHLRNHPDHAFEVGRRIRLVSMAALEGEERFWRRNAPEIVGAGCLSLVFSFALLSGMTFLFGLGLNGLGVFASLIMSFYLGAATIAASFCRCRIDRDRREPSPSRWISYGLAGSMLFVMCPAAILVYASGKGPARELIGFLLALWVSSALTVSRIAQGLRPLKLRRIVWTAFRGSVLIVSLWIVLALLYWAVEWPESPPSTTGLPAVVGGIAFFVIAGFVAFLGMLLGAGAARRILSAEVGTWRRLASTR